MRTYHQNIQWICYSFQCTFDGIDKSHSIYILWRSQCYILWPQTIFWLPIPTDTIFITTWSNRHVLRGTSSFDIIRHKRSHLGSPDWRWIISLSSLPLNNAISSFDKSFNNTTYCKHYWIPLILTVDQLWVGKPLLPRASPRYPRHFRLTLFHSTKCIKSSYPHESKHSDSILVVFTIAIALRTPFSDHLNK